jgi:hypothetical protein
MLWGFLYNCTCTQTTLAFPAEQSRAEQTQHSIASHSAGRENSLCICVYHLMVNSWNLPHSQLINITEVSLRSLFHNMKLVVARNFPLCYKLSEFSLVISMV